MSRESAHRLGVWVCNTLARRYGKPEKHTQRDPLDELVITVLRTNASERAAMRAYRALHAQFVDWNEVRVSSVQAIGEVLAPLPEANANAAAIKGMLTDLFSERHELSLDFLCQERPESARAFLTRLDGVDEQMTARVMLHALDHPAALVTQSIARVLCRLGMINEKTDEIQAQRLIGKALPKDRLYDAHELLAEHARRACLAGAPRCSRCPIRERCRFRRAQRRDRKRAARQGNSTPSAKPRRSRRSR